MPNDFYTPTGNPTDNSNIVSADMRAEFAAINAGFNKLPTLTGNANKLVCVNSSGTGLDVTTTPTGLTSINKVAITQPANGATFTLLDGKTLTVNNTLTLAGTDGTTMTFPATSATLARTDAANTFAGVQDFDGRIDANAGLAVTGANFTSRGITDAATATVVSLSGSGANSITIANSATNPTIGTSGGALALSSATGIVALSSSAATADIQAANTGAGYASFSATSSGTVAAYMFFNNATTGALARLTATNAKQLTIGTGASALTQVQINDTASADRYITLTGSNGGNPTIGTSAGGLLLSPAGTEKAQIAFDGSCSFGGISTAPALLVTPSGTPTNYLQVLGGGTGVGPVLRALGTETDVGIAMQSKGAGGFFFNTNVNSTQVVVTHTASADRYITLTGANAANPKISTSAGSLDIGAAVVFTGQTVGATVGAAGGASALPATPLGYLTTSINGTACKVPYYTA